MIKMIKTGLIVQFLLLASACLFGQSALFMGECIISQLTPEEARLRALQQARMKAIERTCGVQMQSETMVRDYVLSGDFIHSVSYGHIVKETIVNETVKVDQADPDQPPHLTYQITLSAEAVCEQGQPDPSFQIKAETNQKTFVSGQELILRVSASQDCYLTIVNYAADDKVYILMPSRYLTNSFIRSGSTVEIPSESVRRKGIHLQMGVLPGHERATETIQVIATKQKMDPQFLSKTEDGYGVLDGIVTAGTELSRWLSAIPVSDRTMAACMVEISRE